jgi:hypothetical protein
MLAAGVTVLVINFAYMYDLVSRCVASKQCTPYPFWDLLNAAAIVAAASGFIMVIIGSVMLFRAADRADVEAEAKAAAQRSNP